MPAREDFDDTNWESAPGPTSNLLDLCTDAFFLIFYIRAGNTPGNPETFRKDIAALFQNLEKKAKRNRYPDEDIKAARYALCALIDETILNSRWEFKSQWADRSLQLEYFGEALAGERFFDLLERIRAKGAGKIDLLEVFCITLILGFQGKYKLRGREELDRLANEIVGEVISYRGAPTALSPNWRIPEERVEQPAATMPRWIWMTGLVSILLTVLFFAVEKIWLGADIADAIKFMSL
jgi:type VI secretion system protein ImpK